MATLLDPKIDHIECFISDADLFTPAFVQSDIQSGRYEDIPSPNLKTINRVCY